MASNEVALLVVYEYAESAHMIIEHVGTLHVVVVLELQVNTHVPLLPGTGLLSKAEEAVDKADAIGYPVMLKSTAGGGGIGIRICENAAELKDAFDKVRHLAEANFNDSGVFLEKYIRRARHVEVQIFGNEYGEVTAIGERDCSVQRRNQKVVEESPAPGLTDVKGA